MITFVEMVTPRYSVIIPVYNRPDEIRELLESLLVQDFKDFEVILVEDGSTTTCKEVYEAFVHALPIHYFFKPNSGPGPSRNFGFEHAKGKYFVMFDSDCILPPHYFSAVESFIKETPLDAWGGADSGHTTFTEVQRAMAHTMSSVLTTGGIRGGDKRMGWFQPRSFNMGISRQVFEKTGGFKFDRFAEDIEWSMRIKEAGFTIGYIPEAYVFHKRRTTFSQFYKQVSNFGRGRVMVGRKHPKSVRLTHWFPALFLMGLFLLPFISLWNVKLALLGGGFYFLYLLLICIEAYMATSSWKVAILCIPSTIIQLAGYGAGFMREKLKTLHQ